MGSDENEGNISTGCHIIIIYLWTPYGHRRRHERRHNKLREPTRPYAIQDAFRKFYRFRLVYPVFDRTIVRTWSRILKLVGSRQSGRGLRGHQSVIELEGNQERRAFEIGVLGEWRRMVGQEGTG